MRVLNVGFQLHEHFKTGGDAIRKRNYAFLSAFFGPENVYIYPSQEPKFLLFNFFFRRLRGLSNGLAFSDKELSLVLQREKIDVVFIDGALCGRFTKSFFRKYRTISFFHNIESDYFAAKESSRRRDGLLHFNIFRVFFIDLSYWLIYRNERRICKYSDTVICLNQRDSMRMQQLYGRGADLILPTSLQDKNSDQGSLDSQVEEKTYLLFVGSDFYGNTEGLFWFCEKCMCDIDAHLLVVGTGMDKYRDKYSTEKIHFVGYVEDLKSVYQNATAVVLPIISGSGMKTKTCEAMMYGKVIFGTRECFEGYRIQESSDCILCEGEKDFIDKINVFVAGNKNVYSANNRELYLKYYEDKVVEKIFMNYMKENYDT